MKKFCFVIVLVLAMFCVGCDTSTNIVGTLISIDESSSTKDIARLVKPAIVGVGGISDSGESIGSGVCVASGGYVLTNSHVINGCEKIILYLHNGDTTTAHIVYEDPVLDLAIIRSKISMPYLSLGDSDELEVGQDILAVGTPLSLTLVHTYTKGIVSALNRTIKVGSASGEGYMQNLIQHDASLNPGNSGGPLINSRGEVVGINTLKISGGEGIGFAIPAKSFKTLLSSYVNRINYKKPYIGVYGYDNEIAKFNNKTDLNKGFFVIDVAENSPLKTIGLKPNSVIVEFNNKKINNTLDLREELYKVETGDFVIVKYYSNGQYYQSKVQI